MYNLEKRVEIMKILEKHGEKVYCIKTIREFYEKVEEIQNV